MIPEFRAWDKQRKEMWKVATLHIEDEYADLFKTNIYEKPFDNPWAKFEDLILMQSTGLKDLKGVEIFEGDILLYTSKSINYGGTYWHSYVQVYRMDNGAYRIKGEHIYDTELMSVRKHVEVVGNIYENAELLNKDRFMTEY